MTRFCKACQTEKPLEDFTKDKYKKHGRGYTCKKCILRRKVRKVQPVRSTKEGHKICGKCGVEKELKDFYKEADGFMGVRGRCKPCEDLRLEKYRDSNRERTQKRDRDKYANLSPKKKKEYIRKKSLQNANRPGILEWRKQYNSSDRGIFYRYKHDAKRRSRNYSFTIPFEEFSALLNSACHYCGTSPSRGVDRFDNALGYESGNCVPCCSMCNEMKMDHPVEKWMSHIKQIIKHSGDGSES